MGFPRKSKADSVLLVESLEDATWVVMTGMMPPLKPPLKRVKTRSTETQEDELEVESCTTPTSAESRIPVKVPCPAAPRKPKAKPRCISKVNGVAPMEFFIPQDFESVFTMRRRISN